jgi:hypothetical protein
MIPSPVYTHFFSSDRKTNLFLTIMTNEVDFMAQTEGARRDSIIADIVTDDLQCPELNIHYNG